MTLQQTRLHAAFPALPTTAFAGLGLLLRVSRS
jgi:hypothetical protein